MDVLHELGKYAAAVTAVVTQDALEQKLKPGDILITTNAPAHAANTATGRLAMKVLRTGIRKVYGDAGHAAIYVGGGKTVEMSETLRHWDLSHTTKGKDVHVFRPTIAAKEKRKVVDALVEKADTAGASIRYVKPGTLARALVEEFRGRPLTTKERAGDNNRFNCTNVIAAAYDDVAGLKFNPNKSVAFVSPTDFVNSKHTTHVTSFYNPKRHDIKERLGVQKAAAAQFASIAEMHKALKPGDIIVTSPIANTADRGESPVAWAGEEVFKQLNHKFYGDDAHAAIYVGDGQAVEMRSKLELKPIAKALTSRDAKVLRPMVEDETRALAAKRAKALVSAKGGTAKYPGNTWLLKLLAADTRLGKTVASSHDAGIKKDQMTCSNAISTAYKGLVNFHADKPHGFITPKDLVQSPKTEEVGTFLNRKRWDKERRAWTA